MLVVPCDIQVSGETNSFGADEGSHSLCVFVAAENPTVTHYDLDDVGVHLGIDKGDVVYQICTPFPDCFNRSWSTAEHTLERRGRARAL